MPSLLEADAVSSNVTWRYHDLCHVALESLPRALSGSTFFFLAKPNRMYNDTASYNDDSHN